MTSAPPNPSRPENPSDPAVVEGLLKFALLAGSAVAGANGFFVMMRALRAVGLARHVALLEAMGSAVNPSSASCLLICAVALLLQRKAPVPARRSMVARVLGSIALLAGCIRLMGYVFGWIAYDEFHAVDQWLRGGGIFSPGMAPNTAFNLILVGLGLSLLDARSPSALRVAQSALLLAALIAMLALVGYAYGIGSFTRLTSYVPMAPQTGAALALIALGALASRPTSGVVATLSSAGVGGGMARRLLPAAALIPLVAGAVRLLGERYGFYDTDFGVAISWATSVVVLLAVIWNNASWLNETDRERLLAEQAVRESEGRLQAILDNSPDVIFMKDAAGRYILVNRIFEKLFHVDRARIFGMTDTEIFPADLAEAFQKNDRQVIETGRAIQVEEIAPHDDGPHTYITTKFPLRAGEERVSVMCGIATDITERKRAEQEVHDLYNKAPCGYHSLDRDGRIVQINDTELGWLGYTREEAIGMAYLADMLPQERRPDFDRHFAEFKSKGSITGLEVELKRRDGTRFPALLNAVWVKDAEGNFLYTRSTLFDITDRKAAERTVQALNEDLSQRNEMLEAANKELEAFSYSVSHDLRAPLRSISGFSEAILQDHAAALDETGKDYLERVRSAAQRMSQLIDDMLKLSRVTRSHMRRERVDLTGLAREIAADLRRQAPERDARFLIGEGIAANGDADLLRIVLTNLLENAWKFTSKREHAVIEFGVADGGAGPRAQTPFCVRDNGAGFEPAYADKLFRAFQRLHTAEEFPGTGIGLATVARIIHRHGGRVWATSSPGSGAAIYFTL